MNDVEPNAAESVVTKPAKPRLSILHLLVWTGLTAITLTLGNRELQAARSIGQIFSEILSSMAQGVYYGGPILWLSRRWKRMPFPTEPGEWMMTVGGAGWILWLALTPLWKYLGSHNLIDVLVAISQWVLPILELSTFLIPLFFCRKTGVWRIFFGISAARVMFVALGNAWSVMQPYDPARFDLFFVFWCGTWIICTLLLIITLVQDARKHFKRGWAHAAGITAYVTLDMVSTISVLSAALA